MAGQFITRKACPVCASEEALVLCEMRYDDERMASFLRDFYRGRLNQAMLGKALYRVLQCRQCELLYQDPILDTAGMAALYEDWVDHETSLDKKRQAKTRLFKQYAGQMQTVQALFGDRPGEISILEYGMGWGYWSRMAQAHGFDVSGFELSDLRRRHARAMGLNVIDELPPAGPHYRYIFANQVFEHLAEPLATLVELCARLAPDGVVNIRVPDGRGVAAGLRRRGWSSDMDAVHPLEHINCFNRSSLKQLAARAGLQPFNPPLRLHWGSLVGGIRREIADRFLTTQMFFRRNRDRH